MNGATEVQMIDLTKVDQN